MTPAPHRRPLSGPWPWGAVDWQALTGVALLAASAAGVILAILLCAGIVV